MARIRYLKTVEEVIDALGGDEAVGRLTNHKPRAVAAWRYVLGALPSKTYVILRRALAEEGYEAPDKLWGMISHKERAS